MAKAPAIIHDAEKNGAVQKDSGIVTLLIAAAILTLIAAGGGWFLGAKIGKEVAPVIKSENAALAKNALASSKGLATTVTQNSAVVTLTPILTNLAAPTSTWIRMEISLVAKSGEMLNPILVSDISNDFIAFLHASTIAQLKGSSALMNLREDLLDRARIRSDGLVTNVLISGLVIEQ